MGSLVNPRRVSSMIELTQDVIDRGASVAVGGETIFWRDGQHLGADRAINVPLEAKGLQRETSI
jgi:hypothetical protein